MDLERIAEMERFLAETTEASAKLTASLDRMDALREPMIRLFAYYGSEEWFADREGELPAGFPAGVLSEDLVYDQITELREAAFRMMTLATDILRNRI